MDNEPLCKLCNHTKDRHFDLIDEDSGGNLRADWGCWECEEGACLSPGHRYEETRD